MKPAPGRYVLTSTTTPPLAMSVDVDETGANVTFGRLTWEPAEDWFRHPKADVIIRCEGIGVFTAVVRAGKPDQQAYEGTCTGPT